MDPEIRRRALAVPQVQKLQLVEAKGRESGHGIQVKITTISAKYGCKANLGDFSSVDVECALWAALDEDDSPTESIRQLFDTARTEVNEQLWPLVGHVEASVTRLFGGKPIVSSHR